MGNKRKRRSRRVESQSSDRDANTSETSFTQGKATLVEVSEQNNHKMTQIEQQLNSNFEEILKRIRTNRESNLANDEEDVEDNGPSTSNPDKNLRRKHASNNEIDIDRNQDNRFQSSKMYELGQPRTSFGVANETLDDTIIINENRQENADYHMMIGGLGLADYHMVTGVGLADYHMVTGPTKNILRQNSNKTNDTNTLGRNAEPLFLKHPEPPDPVNQIPQPIEKRAGRNSKPSTSKDFN